MENETSIIMSPLIQYGFAGFSLVLLVVIIWLIRELLTVLKATNKVISENTQAIKTMSAISGTSFQIMVEIKDELLKRPCIARFKQE